MTLLLYCHRACPLCCVTVAVPSHGVCLGRYDIRCCVSCCCVSRMILYRHVDHLCLPMARIVVAVVATVAAAVVVLIR